MLTEEKLDDIGARLEHSPKKSLRQLAWQCGISATKALHLKPYHTTDVHKISETDNCSRTWFCNWLMNTVVDGQVDSQLTFFSDEAYFHLSGYNNLQNN